jgi:hypothetical protein
MHTTNLILVLSILTFAATSKSAAQPSPTPPTVSYIGTGTLNCGTFIQYKEAGNREQLDLFVQWVWGFMSAYTFRSHFVKKWEGPAQNGNIAELPESPTVLLYLEKHCRERPLDKIVDATIALLQASGGNVIWKPNKP